MLQSQQKQTRMPSMSGLQMTGVAETRSSRACSQMTPRRIG